MTALGRLELPGHEIPAEHCELAALEVGPIGDRLPSEHLRDILETAAAWSSPPAPAEPVPADRRLPHSDD